MNKFIFFFIHFKLNILSLDFERILKKMLINCYKRTCREKYNLIQWDKNRKGVFQKLVKFTTQVHLIKKVI